MYKNVLTRTFCVPDHNPELENQECQLQTIAKIYQDMGANETGHLPFRKRSKLFIRRHLSLNTRRNLKKILYKIVWWHGDKSKIKPAKETRLSPSEFSLKAGDRVQVRSKEEILATLNIYSELKGCGFISEMWQYCGTTQKVLKPVTRFVDERNYQIKKSRGIVLLEGVICTGTNFYGKCDRSCFLFWREEWLERI